ncbi:MAG: hypothetical protein MRY81_17025 [Donghicola eburneus]|nr:hypothetical protein [Donghicola eburneus]MCI5041373.1 hypothetical protein [Donghicola eburneus]
MSEPAIQGKMQDATACPSCDFDGWKSAKMVVLEGTTQTTGTASGSITDPGRFSGKLSDFFLSDRWFSWDHPIEMDMELQTTSALVESVKQLMVTEGALKPMPKEPVRPKSPQSPASPKSYGFFTKARPQEPTDEPEDPAFIEPPQLKSWFAHYRGSILTDLILSFAIVAVWTYFFPQTVRLAEYLPWLSALVGQVLPAGFTELLGISAEGHAIIINKLTFVALLMAIGTASSLYGSFSKNDQLMKAHEKKLKRVKSGHQKALARHQESLERYKAECAKKLQQEQDEKEDQARYEKETAEYEVALLEYKAECKKQDEEFRREKAAVRRYRELLWMRARICTRCGTAYLGNDTQQG